MGKAPAFQFYPNDWTRDLDDQDLEVEGAWIRVCCRLHWSNPYGQATKSLREWSRILRKTEKKTLKIFQILIEKHIASGSVLDNQNITIISRRMVNDEKIRNIRREVGKLGGNPQLLKSENSLDNQSDNQKPTPSSSSSSSSSRYINTYSECFLNFWEVYPIKIGKGQAWRIWKKNKNIPEISILIEAIKKQKEWRAQANGEFRPQWKHPATWLNSRGWEDETLTTTQEDIYANIFRE